MLPNSNFLIYNRLDRTEVLFHHVYTLRLTLSYSIYDQDISEFPKIQLMKFSVTRYSLLFRARSSFH